MTRYSSTMTEALQEIREGFSSKQIKMAIGIASDKRYAGGNMTGAVNAIEKIKKGLSDHPQVAAVLKRQNEDIQEDGHTDVASAKNQVKVAMTALQKMEMELGKLNDEDSLPSWWTNKVAIAVDKIDGMADYLDTQVEEVELDEMAYKPGSFKDTRPQEKAANALNKLIQSGGLDKSDFQKARQLYVQASDAASRDKLKKFISNLDTEPLEAIMDVIGRNDPDTFQKMYPKSKAGEYLSSISYNHRNVKAEDVILDELEENKESIEYVDEMKMDDPKLVKHFDKLKRGDTIKLKTSSTINQGKDFVEYIVKSKNVVNKGRVEKITLVTKGNEKAVKKFLYKRDGKVTFAIGDMGASIDDIKEEQKEPIQWPSQPLEEKLKVSDGLGAWIDDFKKSDAPQFQGKSDEEKKNMAIAAFTDAGGKLEQKEETELDEKAPKMKYALVGKDMKIYSMGSDERDLRLDRRSLEQRFKDAAPLKLARLKTAQSIGDKVDKSQLKEEEEPNKPDSAKEVDKVRDDKKKTRIAQLQLQIAKASETINKLNAQEK